MKNTNTICPKCKEEMRDGELVHMDWSGNATEHIVCPSAQYEGHLVESLLKSVDSYGIEYIGGRRENV